MSALPEARESLTYWESRLETLPRRAVHKRREAREMATRWRDRVCEAEQAQYGAGLLGALVLLVAEQRLPTRTQHTTRSVARTARNVALALIVAVAALSVLVVVALVAALAAIF
jgi:hypothetical protein